METAEAAAVVSFGLVPDMRMARWMDWASFMSGYLAAVSPLADGVTYSFLVSVVVGSSFEVGSTSILDSSVIIV